MKKLSRILSLIVILAFYAGLYLATSPNEICEVDCEKLESVGALLLQKSSVKYAYGTERIRASTYQYTIPPKRFGRDWRIQHVRIYVTMGSGVIK